MAIRNLDAHRSLSWNRSEDTDRLRLQIHRDVVREIRYLLYTHSWSWLDFITRNRRTLLDAYINTIFGIHRNHRNLKLR